MDESSNHQEYIYRINRVVDYIESNLSEKFVLDELALIACFSKFHFHRIFASVVGETLFQFIRRLRLEKAASVIVSTKNPITDIAFDCGFESSAAFAKAFKKHFKMSASEFRENPNKESDNLGQQKSNIGQTVSKDGKELKLVSMHTDNGTKNQHWRYEMKDQKREVKIENLSTINTAYVRHVGAYKGDASLFENLYNKMFAWAGPRGFVTPNLTSYIIYHDDPAITEEAKLRTSVCLPVPKGTETSGEIGTLEIVDGKYATYFFEINVDEYPAAWEWMYGTWLPQSGFQTGDGPAFERYLHEGEHDPDAKCKVDICIPVKPL